MPKIIRRKTATVLIGHLKMGGDHPIIVQSMTNTPTADMDSTWAQTMELIETGAEMVRWTINNDAAASAAVKIIQRLREDGVDTPIVGDFHFNGHELLRKHPDLAAALDKYRINPGNIGSGSRKDEHFAALIRTAVQHKKAVRIGVNWGSLDKNLLASLMDANRHANPPKNMQEIMYEAMVESALVSCHYAQELGLPKEKIVVSAKLSVVQDVIEVYQRLSRLCDYVLHVGLTEAGAGIQGIASSAAGLAVLLQQGIGDTIRVSLTPEPATPRSREVLVAREILQSMGFRYFIPSVTSCPGCGRTSSLYFQKLAREVKEHVDARICEWRERYPGVEKLRIAVMGCVVNGPGESRHADIGISLPGSFEDPVAPVFIDGKKSVTLKGERIREEFIAILEDYVKQRFART